MRTPDTSRFCAWKWTINRYLRRGGVRQNARWQGGYPGFRRLSCFQETAKLFNFRAAAGRFPAPTPPPLLNHPQNSATVLRLILFFARSSISMTNLHPIFKRASSRSDRLRNVLRTRPHVRVHRAPSNDAKCNRMCIFTISM